jgi:hypothetical protein
MVSKSEIGFEPNGEGMQDWLSMTQVKEMGVLVRGELSLGEDVQARHTVASCNKSFQWAMCSRILISGGPGAPHRSLQPLY